MFREGTSAGAFAGARFVYAENGALFSSLSRSVEVWQDPWGKDRLSSGSRGGQLKPGDQRLKVPEATLYETPNQAETRTYGIIAGIYIPSPSQVRNIKGAKRGIWDFGYGTGRRQNGNARNILEGITSKRGCRGRDTKPATQGSLIALEMSSYYSLFSQYPLAFEGLSPRLPSRSSNLLHEYYRLC